MIKVMDRGFEDSIEKRIKGKNNRFLVILA
jgi:hypothetical protein